MHILPKPPTRGPKRRFAVFASAALSVSALALGAACSDDGTEASGATAATTTIADGASTTVVATPADESVAPDAATETTAVPVEGVEGADGAPSTTTPGGSPLVTTTIATSASTTVAPSSPSTSLLKAASGLGEVLAKNSQGDDIRLDETALLACAQNQIAWVELQRDAPAAAAEALGIAAERAKASSVADVSDSAGALSSAASNKSPQRTVDTFLKLCTDHGFEY